MNCRPGDLAWVTSKAVTPFLAGRFVIVESSAGADIVEVDGELFLGGEPGWVCVAADGGLLPIQKLLDDSVDWVRRRVISDCVLRPIRDPGDDAVDQMVDRVPVEHPEVHA
jgi:hypothetical protein